MAQKSSCAIYTYCSTCCNVKHDCLQLNKNVEMFHTKEQNFLHIYSYKTEQVKCFSITRHWKNALTYVKVRKTRYCAKNIIYGEWYHMLNQLGILLYFKSCHNSVATSTYTTALSFESALMIDNQKIICSNLCKIC